MDHLVVYSVREINKIRKKRRARLVWVRKRREPPVGAVKKGDLLYFKSPGGGVFAWTRVLGVKDSLRAGRYVVSLSVRRPRIFAKPFSVVKRDRRSWVICKNKNNDNQQPLLPLPSPSLADCIKAVKNHYRGLPSSRQIMETIQHFAEGEKNAGKISGLLLLLAIISAGKKEIDLDVELRRLLTKNPESVFPLAVFRGK